MPQIGRLVAIFRRLVELRDIHQKAICAGDDRTARALLGDICQLELVKQRELQVPSYSNASLA